VPLIFGQVVESNIADILDHQTADGFIEYNPRDARPFPQQAIMPLAFCWAGLGPTDRWKRDPRLGEAIGRLGDYLATWYGETGVVTYENRGYHVTGVDQRLTYAWTEALRILRDAGGDFALGVWGDKIGRACRTLFEERVRALRGVRRFIVRTTGTGTNHVVLYLSTIYRAGMVLGRRDLCDDVLPVARAMAADMHPDGYWDEHSDVLRSGGPTPSYNYLCMGAIHLLAEWTREPIFQNAADRAAWFHANFCYPDGMFCDLMDERVRCDLSPRAAVTRYDSPRIWGLHAMSTTPEGRASAVLHLTGWLNAKSQSRHVSAEALARMVENYLYWKIGPISSPPTDRPDHAARLTLPAGLFRSGAWCIGLSCIRALTPGDDAYRNNPWALERQKVFSVWHERVGLIIDGSHSKFQPDNSTFAATPDQGHDYYPVGGELEVSGDEFIARPAYKTFFGVVRLRVIDARTLRIKLSIDPAATNGPFTAAFTLRMLDRRISSLGGEVRELAPSEAWSLTGAQLGGGFTFGPITLTGPSDFRMNWPLSPFNSYAADHVSRREASVPRVSIELTPERPEAEWVLKVK
jgi:hypothetical protein